MNPQKEVTKNDTANYRETISKTRDFVLNKIGLISAAVYVVTDHIKDTESIKDSLRSISVKTVTELHQFQYKKDVALGHLRTLDALLSVAETVGLVSLANVRILLEETGYIEKLLSEEEGVFSPMRNEASPVTLENLFGSTQLLAQTNNIVIKKEEPKFSTGAKQYVQQNEQSSVKKLFTNVIKGNPADVMRRIGQMSNAGKNVSKGQNFNKRTDSKKNPRLADMAMKSERRNTILKIIKDKGEVSIKDISLVIKDCSEKTLQRELIGMTSEGTLGREGNKRWARYFVADR